MAFALSFLVPGLGQFYNGNWIKGLFQEAILAGGVTLAVLAGFRDDYSSYYESDYGSTYNPYTGNYEYGRTGGHYEYSYWTEKTEWFWVGIGMASAASLWSILDAPISSIRINAKRRAGWESRKEASRVNLMWVPIPGGGHSRVSLAF